MGRFSRGWALAGQSWRVLKSDRSLVVFPVLSATFSTIVAALIFLPAAVVEGLFAGGAQSNENSPVIAAAIVAVMYISTFIAIYFNVALAACAVRSLQGEDTSVGYGISAATSRLGAILGWSLIAATIGLVLRVLRDRLPIAGQIAVALVGAAWSVATFFVIPIIALEGQGPWQSLKRSVTIIKARWGESAVGGATISLASTLIGVAVVIVSVAGAIALVSVGLQVLGFALVAVGAVAVLVVTAVSTALSQIFRVAVYQFAVTEQTPRGFDGEMLQAAFSRR